MFAPAQQEAETRAVKALKKAKDWHVRQEWSLERDRASHGELTEVQALFDDCLLQVTGTTAVDVARALSVQEWVQAAHGLLERISAVKATEAKQGAHGGSGVGAKGGRLRGVLVCWCVAPLLSGTALVRSLATLNASFIGFLFSLRSCFAGDVDVRERNSAVFAHAVSLDELRAVVSGRADLTSDFLRRDQVEALFAPLQALLNDALVCVEQLKDLDGEGTRGVVTRAQAATLAQSLVCQVDAPQLETVAGAVTLPALEDLLRRLHDLHVRCIAVSVGACRWGGAA